MSDDVVAAVQEVARLLQQQIDYTVEAHRRAQERMASIPKPPPIQDFGRTMEAALSVAEEDAKRDREQGAEFRMQVLASLEEQTTLLKRLVEHLGRRAPRGARATPRAKAVKSRKKSRKPTRGRAS